LILGVIPAPPWECDWSTRGRPLTCSCLLLSMDDCSRCAVEKILFSTLAERKGVLPKEGWIKFLQIIGGTEKQAHALLKDSSVKSFLDLIFSDSASKVLSKGNGNTKTSNLRDYFEHHYREGGEFWHVHYQPRGDAQMWTWLHRPTGIQVWQDAIDLTSGHGGEVYFHYTSEVAFKNITHASKEAAEIWASLKTDGPNANAWWGKGIYTVPLPPDQWQNREQLLDNNFRNMMRRDRENPERGSGFVDREYPKRAAFCVPILIDACNAFDVSKKATPEMEAAGKEPGRNLADKLLNEPGMPLRCCVVLRVSGEDGVHHACARLLDVLRARASATTDWLAKWRLAAVLKCQGLVQEALPLVQNLLASFECSNGRETEHSACCADFLSEILLQRCNYLEAERLQRRALAYYMRWFGPEAERTLLCLSRLASTLQSMGDESQAEEIYRRVKDASERALGPEHKLTLDSSSDLALLLTNAGRHREAIDWYRQILDIKERTCGPLHPETLHSLTNVAITLTTIRNFSEAVELHRRGLDARERTLGKEHPQTLQSLSHLAVTLHDMGNFSEAEELQRRALDVRERILGPQHPSTLRSLERLVLLLKDMGKESEAAELQKRAAVAP